MDGIVDVINTSMSLRPGHGTRELSNVIDSIPKLTEETPLLSSPFPMRHLCTTPAITTNASRLHSLCDKQALQTAQQ